VLQYFQGSWLCKEIKKGSIDRVLIENIDA